MQPKNLGWKFAFVALLLATCVYTIYFNELRQGIDLKGGHVLVFEVQSTGKEGPDLVQRVIQTLQRPHLEVHPGDTSSRCRQHGLTMGLVNGH